MKNTTLLDNLQTSVDVLELPEVLKQRLEACGDKHGAFLMCGCDIKQVAYRCGYYRLCEKCGRIKNFKLTKELMQYFINYSRHKQKGGFRYRIRLLTLTLKISKDVSQTITDIQKGYRRLRQQKYFKKNCKAGIYTIEINKSDCNWYVHLHSVIYSKFLNMRIKNPLTNNAKLIDSWILATKGHGRIADIRLAENQIGAVKYILKYVTKPNPNLSERDRAFLYHACKGRKLLIKFYDFHNFKIPKFIAICPNCKCPYQFLLPMSEEVQIYLRSKQDNDIKKPPNLYNFLENV